MCHKKLSIKNKKCSCGSDLDKLKRSDKVKFWINYRLEGKQRTEYVGNSKKEAEDALGKRKVQIREHRIFDILPESRMTFRELAEWYLNLSSTKGLRSHERIKSALNIIVEHFGNRTIESIKPSDIEDFIAKKTTEGRKPATIHMEVTVAKMAINKALENDLVSARTLKTFRTVKGPLKTGSNARTRIVGLDEYLKLMKVAPHYLRVALTLGLYCGMRRGEICGLQWSEIDLKSGFIRLPASRTKEARPKTIPLAPAVKKILSETPRAIHNDYVILDKGKPVFIGTFTNSVKFACRKAGIAYGLNTEGGMRLHDLRATWKTGAAKAGIDSAMRNKLLGHALEGMDRYYLRFTDEDLKAAMDKYTAWLEGELQNVHQCASRAS